MTGEQMSAITVGTGDFRKFEKSLKAAIPYLRVELDAQLKVAGRMVADQAKANISPVSSQLAGTIKVSLARGNVAITQSRKRPIAGLLEFGGGAGGDSWIHPAWGKPTDPPIRQKTHPYFYKALEQKKDEAMQMINIAVDRALRQAGEI